MTQRFDTIVVGTGPAASRIVEACAERLRIAVVDNRGIGGTCALRGCNPKKVLVHAAELFDAVRNSQGKLLRADDVRIDWPALIDFKDTFTDPVTPNTKAKYRDLGVTMFEGGARFVGETALDVDGHPIEAEHVVVCTGARPQPLPFPGADLVTTSDAFLDTRRLPDHVVFVGGGYISFEFAHVARRAGAKVTILEQSERPLAGFEPRLVDRLVEYGRERGIDVRTECEVRSVERTGDGELNVHVSEGPPIVAGLVVHGAGRVPNVAGLDLEIAGVAHDEQGIHVDPHLRSTSNPRVFAAGDVVRCEQPKLTPVANEQGRTVARILLGEPRALPDYGVVPRVLFTVPPLASLGLDEHEARDAGHACEVREGDASEWGSVRKAGGDLAGYRILVERDTDRLLGAHLLGPNAAETINLLALAMKFDLSATDVKSVLMAFPTFTSDVRRML